MKNNFLHYSWRIMRTVLVIYFFILLVGCASERYIFFQPHKMPETSPEKRVMIQQYFSQKVNIKNVDFKSQDGTVLHGVLFLSGDTINEETIPVLFCHGNGGWLANHLNWVFFDYRPGPAEFALFLFDYRAYGYSGGTQSELDENKFYEDARAARKWLADYMNRKESEVALMGHSLGGAVAVDLAQDGTPKLLLFATFDTLPKVAQQHVPIYPASWLMKNRFDSITKITSVKAPIFYVHGKDDFTVPYKRGKRLFEAAKEPKEMITLSRGHNDLTDESGLYEKIKDFLKKESDLEKNF
ncbi:MAG: alpha/beta hydrolase [Planctomycetia bacterium]|nr:alpha/beta hydrolase [Planctomycetia bacterium]